MTLDRYGHLMPGNEGEAAEMLEVYLGGWTPLSGKESRNCAEKSAQPRSVDASLTRKRGNGLFKPNPL
jgi:hypothetical protein